jgi:hypothetical protein
MSGTALPGNAMMKRLVFLLLLGSCAGTADTPPDPTLRDVKTSYVHADPDWIRQRGQVIGLARSRDRTMAFNTLRRLEKPVVMLEYKGENHGLREPKNMKSG